MRRFSRWISASGDPVETVASTDRGTRVPEGVETLSALKDARSEQALDRHSKARQDGGEAGHGQIRAGDRDAVKHVFHAGDLAQDLSRSPRLPLEKKLVLAIDPNVDRLGLAAREITDRVSEELAKIGSDGRLGERLAERFKSGSVCVDGWPLWCTFADFSRVS